MTYIQKNDHKLGKLALRNVWLSRKKRKKEEIKKERRFRLVIQEASNVNRFVPRTSVKT